MSIERGTLAKNVDGVIKYVYPKTEAALVEYDQDNSVKDKIEVMDDNLNTINIYLNESLTELTILKYITYTYTTSLKDKIKINENNISEKIDEQKLLEEENKNLNNSMRSFY